MRSARLLSVQEQVLGLGAKPRSVDEASKWCDCWAASNRAVSRLAAGLVAGDDAAGAGDDTGAGAGVSAGLGLVACAVGWLIVLTRTGTDWFLAGGRMKSSATKLAAEPVVAREATMRLRSKAFLPSMADPWRLWNSQQSVRRVELVILEFRSHVTIGYCLENRLYEISAARKPTN